MAHSNCVLLKILDNISIEPGDTHHNDVNREAKQVTNKAFDQFDMIMALAVATKPHCTWRTQPHGLHPTS